MAARADIGWPLLLEGEYEERVELKVRYKATGRWESRADEPIVTLESYRIIDNPLDQPEVAVSIGDKWWAEYAHIACESDENE